MQPGYGLFAEAGGNPKLIINAGGEENMLMFPNGTITIRGDDGVGGFSPYAELQRQTISSLLFLSSTADASSSIEMSSGTGFQVNLEDGLLQGNDAIPVLKLTDGLLDMSDMTAPSEIKMKMYSQATQPTLDADGKFAMWEDTDNSKLYFLARNNGTTKAVELN